MAILKDWVQGNTGLTITGAYNRFAGVQIDLLPVPIVAVKVAVYASQAARQAGNDPVTIAYASVPQALATTILGSTAFKALVSRLYTLVVKVDPQWVGGTDVTDPSE